MDVGFSRELGPESVDFIDLPVHLQEFTVSALSDDIYVIGHNLNRVVLG